MLAGHDPTYVRIVWLIACCIGVVSLVVLRVIYRQAKRAHELELAERVISQHDSDAPK
jgi:hypothetical protein